MISQKELKTRFDYNPTSGVFIRKIGYGHGQRIGDRAGTQRNKGTVTYRYILINNKSYAEHRLVWLYVYGNFPEKHIDHINGIGTDNRINNLRYADNKINGKNMKRSKANKSRVTGLYFRKDTNKWSASITPDGKQIMLGCFIDFFEAICARKSAERKHKFHENHGRNI